MLACGSPKSVFFFVHCFVSHMLLAAGCLLVHFVFFIRKSNLAYPEDVLNSAHIFS